MISSSNTFTPKINRVDPKYKTIRIPIKVIMVIIMEKIKMTKMTMKI